MNDFFVRNRALLTVVAVLSVVFVLAWAGSGDFWIALGAAAVLGSWALVKGLIAFKQDIRAARLRLATMRAELDFIEQALEKIRREHGECSVQALALVDKAQRTRKVLNEAQERVNRRARFELGSN